MLKLHIENILDREEKIMAEWMKTSLIDIVDLVGGGTPKTSKAEYWGGNINWLSVKDFNNEKRYVYSTEKTITEEGLNNSSTKLLKKDDIIISARGTVGELAMIPFPMAFNQSCYGIRSKEGTDSTFLYYLIKNSVRMFKAMTHGSVFDTITRDTFANIEVVIPDIEMQHRIAKILADIDDKIENNERIDDNLFEQMQALYKDWFVNFEPFGGVRPSGWNKTNIYAIANIIYGAPFASKLFNTDGLGKPIIRIRDLKEQTFVTFTTEEHPKGHLIQPGDIVVGMDGEFRPYIWGNESAWLNQRVCIFESNRPKGKAFVLYTIKPLLNKIEQTQVATTVIHIGKKDFDAFEIVLPDEATLDSFDSITAPMVEKIVNNSLQNKRLAVLRDTLLPKLMSGELDVSRIDL